MCPEEIPVCWNNVESVRWLHLQINYSKFNQNFNTDVPCCWWWSWPLARPCWKWQGWTCSRWCPKYCWPCTQETCGVGATGSRLVPPDLQTRINGTRYKLLFEFLENSFTCVIRSTTKPTGLCVFLVYLLSYIVHVCVRQGLKSASSDKD